MRPLDLDTRTIRSNDGTELSYQVSAGQGQCIVLINGLAGRFKIWHHLIDYLGGDYRLLSWDYRELYDRASSPSTLADGGLVATHAHDLATILKAEQIEQAVWVTWSVGSQVALEAMGGLRLGASHLIMVNPTFGAMQAGPLAPVRSTLAPRALKYIERSHLLAEAIAGRVARWPEIASWLKRLGLVGPTIDQEALAEVAGSFAELNMQAFIRNLRAFELHDAGGRLDSVQIPTLLITGQRDLLAPREKAEAAARRIAGSETFLIRGCTHYAPLEFPELLNLRIEKFLREHGA